MNLANSPNAFCQIGTKFCETEKLLRLQSQYVHCLMHGRGLLGDKKPFSSLFLSKEKKLFLVLNTRVAGVFKLNTKASTPTSAFVKHRNESLRGLPVLSGHNVLSLANFPFLMGLCFPRKMAEHWQEKKGGTGM